LKTTLATLAALCAAAASACGEERESLRYHHPWGRCGVGSSQTTRTVTETFDELGQPQGVTTNETRTTLEAVSADGVTLRLDVVLEVGGKRVTTQPQTIRQSFSGALANQTVNHKRLPDAPLKIDSREILCHEDELEILGQGQKRMVRISYTDKSPLILKRMSNVVDASNPSGNSDTTTETIELDMPYKVLSEIKTVSLLRSVQTNPTGVTTTLSVSAPDIPGELVATTSKKVDAQGRISRRTVSELAAYRIFPLPTEPTPNWTPLRHRDKRHRR
jgi:hypothetical protein